MKKLDADIDENGKVTFSLESWRELRRLTKVKSKRYRIIKKSIKRLITKALKELLKEKDE